MHVGVPDVLGEGHRQHRVVGGHGVEHVGLLHPSLDSQTRAGNGLRAVVGEQELAIAEEG